ncbi:MauE/DoxX family redox-associated membrane protein [Nocardioides terrisoli]|uniref:MauE/DoxX family redox-associated membrane protein n=1 Tax=Nocardioides terrisoli TaxID=3388267 RepID=UPI00287BC990|nr:MauE/DoxX family redox-associated membrane protein [Nocardioides marmorisolisilvae]
MATLAAATALALVFAVSAVLKARTTDEFALFVASLRDYGLRSFRVRRVIAAGAITAEAAAALILAVPVSTLVRRVMVVVSLLLVLTLVNIIRAALGGEKRACHCFGSKDTAPLWLHITGNCVLLTLGAIGVLGIGAGTATPGDALFGAGLGLILGAAVVGSGFLYASLAPAQLAVAEASPRAKL